MREKETQRCLIHSAGRQPSKTSSPRMPPTASSPRASPSSTGARTSLYTARGGARPSSPAGFAMRPPSAASCPRSATGSRSRRPTRRSIHAVLPRQTKFSRMAATDHGQTIEQVVAANVDIVFLTAGLDGDLNVRRLERYLDARLGERGRARRRPDEGRSVRGRRGGAPRRRVGRDRRAGACRQQPHRRRASRSSAPYFAPGRTVAALGSSGVGKSSLVNRLAGEELMATGDLRADGRGRHTTTNRQLLRLPDGGLFLDTPGMRELRLWGSRGGSRADLRRRRRRGRAVPLRRLLARARSRAAASGRRSTTARSHMTATRAGGSSRTSCAGSPSSRTPGSAPRRGRRSGSRLAVGGRSPGEPAPARLGLLPFGTRRQPPGLPRPADALGVGVATRASGRLPGRAARGRSSTRAAGRRAGTCRSPASGSARAGAPTSPARRSLRDGGDRSDGVLRGRRAGGHRDRRRVRAGRSNWAVDTAFSTSGCDSCGRCSNRSGSRRR